MVRARAITEICQMLATAESIKDPAELAIVERCLPPAAVALALTMAEGDPQWGPRWAAAGTDWVERGQILHEAILFILRPEEQAVPA